MTYGGEGSAGRCSSSGGASGAEPSSSVHPRSRGTSLMVVVAPSGVTVAPASLQLPHFSSLHIYIV